MIYISKKEWKAIPLDYKGISIQKPMVKVVFEGCVPGHQNGGTNLLFEHEHFEIV